MLSVPLVGEAARRKKAVFEGSEHDLAAGHPHLVAGIVKREWPDRHRALQGKGGVVGGDLRAPDDGQDVCQELLHTERLGQIIIGAQLKAPHLVLVLPAGRQDDDWHRRALADGLVLPLSVVDNSVCAPHRLTVHIDSPYPYYKETIHAPHFQQRVQLLDMVDNSIDLCEPIFG